MKKIMLLLLLVYSVMVVTGLVSALPTMNHNNNVNGENPVSDGGAPYSIKVNEGDRVIINVRNMYVGKAVVMNVAVGKGVISQINIRWFSLIFKNGEDNSAQPQIGSNEVSINVNSPNFILTYDLDTGEYSITNRTDNNEKATSADTTDIPSTENNRKLIVEFKLDENELHFNVDSPIKSKISVIKKPGITDDIINNDQGTYYPLMKYLNYAYIVYYPIIKYNDRVLAIHTLPEMKYNAQVFIYNKRVDTPVQVNRVMLMSVRGIVNAESNAPIVLTKCSQFNETCPILRVNVKASFDKIYYEQNDIEHIMKEMLPNQYKIFKSDYIKYKQNKEKSRAMIMRIYNSYYKYIMFKYLASGHFMMLVVNVTIEDQEYNLILPIPQYLEKYYPLIKPEMHNMKR